MTFMSLLSVVQSNYKIRFPKGGSNFITKFYFQLGWELIEDEAYRGMKNLRIDLVCQTGENFHQSVAGAENKQDILKCCRL